MSLSRFNPSNMIIDLLSDMMVCTYCISDLHSNLKAQLVYLLNDCTDDFVDGEHDVCLGSVRILMSDNA